MIALPFDDGEDDASGGDILTAQVETAAERKARVRKQKLAELQPAKVERKFQSSRWIAPMEPLRYPPPAPCRTCGNKLGIVGVVDRAEKITEPPLPFIVVWCKTPGCRRYEYPVVALHKAIMGYYRDPARGN